METFSDVSKPTGECETRLYLISKKEYAQICVSVLLGDAMDVRDDKLFL